MMINRATLYLTIAIAIAAVKSSAAWAAAPLPAFQGAEGFGAYTPGGRGGQVIAVTNLNDSGPGSLRAAIETQGPRIVVFGVSGYIDLEKPLRISHPYITITGQTAPGDGICLRNYQSRGHSGQRAPVLRIGRGAQQAGKTGVLCAGADRRGPKSV